MSRKPDYAYFPEIPQKYYCCFMLLYCLWDRYYLNYTAGVANYEIVTFPIELKTFRLSKQIIIHNMCNNYWSRVINNK